MRSIPASYCGKCGAPAAEAGDRHCRGCGASLVVTSGAEASTAEPAMGVGRLPVTWKMSSAPRWPWVLIVLGLLVELIFGSSAAVSLDTIRRIEGTAVDHASDQAYLDARADLIFDSVAFGIGLLVMALGLLILIRWRPVSVLMPISTRSAREVPPPQLDSDPFSLRVLVLPGGLAFAGWLSLTTAILELPLSAMNEALRDQGAREVLFHSAYYVISIPLYAYPLWQLKRLLNVRWGFQEADAVLNWIIGLTLLSLVLGVGADMFNVVFVRQPASPARDQTESTTLTASELVLYVPVIWLYVKLGLKVRRLMPDLFGLSKPFVLACFATVLYLVMPFWKESWLLASAVVVAQYGLLGMIFIRASRDGGHGTSVGPEVEALARLDRKSDEWAAGHQWAHREAARQHAKLGGNGYE